MCTHMCSVCDKTLDTLQHDAVQHHEQDYYTLQVHDGEFGKICNRLEILCL